MLTTEYLEPQDFTISAVFRVFLEMAGDAIVEGASTQTSHKTKICRGCGSQFEPKIGASMQAYCFPSCRQKNNNNKKQAAAQTPTTNSGNKRDGGHLSPHETNSSKKDKREDPNSKERERTMFSLGQEDLMKLETAELTEIILSLRERCQKARQAAMEINKAKLDLEKELIEVKVAFADRSLEEFRRGSGVPARRSYASAAGGHTDGGRAILVAKVEASASPINLSKIDALLGSSLRGPVAQDVRQKDDKVIMTFSDSDSREAARGILEGSQECKVLFSSVSSSTGYFPVIARYMNVGATEEAMLSEIRYRNPVLKEHVKSARVIHRFKDSSEGHVKLWITSREARDNILQRGEIYLSERRCKVVEPDLNREVRRCYKCQQYKV